MMKRLLWRLFAWCGFEVRRRPGTLNEVWIDVGAHLGETTLEAARRNPKLVVFAFEPNWALARQIMGVVANFIVLPVAISDRDGIAEFLINQNDGSSSLAPMTLEGKDAWSDLDLSVSAKVVVPTMRLDTFMQLARIETVHYLKVDAEGADLAVIKSAGDRLKNVCRVKAEVDLLEKPLYEGAPSRDELVSFMHQHGFVLAESQKQNKGRQENLTFTPR